MTLHLTLNANQSNDINNDLWLCTRIWVVGIQSRVQSHWSLLMPFDASIQIQVQSHGSLLMLFDWMAFNQVQSHGSLLMSFDWPTIKSRCRVRLCTWLWMPTNQMTWTMIHDSAPGFECQPIKWHEHWSVTLHLDLNANQSNGMNNDPWLSLLMSFDWLAFKVGCRVTDHC
jgi:hypothetical protein